MSSEFSAGALNSTGLLELMAIKWNYDFQNWPGVKSDRASKLLSGSPFMFHHNFTQYDCVCRSESDFLKPEPDRLPDVVKRHFRHTTLQFCYLHGLARFILERVFDGKISWLSGNKE